MRPLPAAATFPRWRGKDSILMPCSFLSPRSGETSANCRCFAAESQP